MLDETVSREEVKHDDKLPDQAKVTCFVCKREVERKVVTQVDHPREKQVWVCQEHIK